MRILTWNVAGRVALQPRQAEAIGAAAPDVVALQEVSARTLPMWRESLARLGFAAVACGLEGATGAMDAVGARRRLLGVLVAAREPLRRLPTPPGLPWPERVLCCRLGDVEIVNVHSPIAPAPELAKVRTHEAVAAYLAETEPPACVLCGDLNTPRRELPDGDVMTFAFRSSGTLREERGERWDRAERALVHGLRERGWVDAFRSLHGYGEREASWTFADDRGGWRLDHVLVHGLRPVAAAYAHDWRRLGLSDHSALVVDLAAAAYDPAP
jgi:exonuclease III